MFDFPELVSELGKLPPGDQWLSSSATRTARSTPCHHPYARVPAPLRYGLPRDKEIWGDDVGRASEPPSEHRLCLVLSDVPAVLSKPAAARPEGPPPHELVPTDVGRGTTHECPPLGRHGDAVGPVCRQRRHADPRRSELLIRMTVRNPVEPGCFPPAQGGIAYLRSDCPVSGNRCGIGFGGGQCLSVADSVRGPTSRLRCRLGLSAFCP